MAEKKVKVNVLGIPAPKINWINKDEALFYEINEEEGKGVKPFWVDRNDIRVKEARPLLFQKGFKAVEVPKVGSLIEKEWKIEEVNEDTEEIQNILIKGDNLLALNTLKKIFDNKPDSEKVKCIYIDPPYNTQSAFSEFYDDNLEHSEWLTMMRDRLVILRALLREDGSIFVHLDDKEFAYCKLLMDEVFGRNNFCNDIIFKTNAAFGFKSTSDSIFKQANHILFYAKNKENFLINKTYKEKEYDEAYKYIITNINEPESKWEWVLLQNDYIKYLGFSSKKELLETISENDFKVGLHMYAIENAERIFRTASVSGGAFIKRKDTINKSKNIKDKIIRHPNDDMDYMFIGGERIIFYKERLIEIDGYMLPGEIITDIWGDIPIEGIAKEGNVDFPKSKKPEYLIKRIIEIATNENDIILDVFGGSGTTFAVAHKMKRNWIGVEIGNHFNSHIIPRLTYVIEGKDNSGISKLVSWKGGGAFKYYYLGESIISDKDFNWKLGKTFIQESFLSSYDYIQDKEISLNEGKLFTQETLPSVGIQKIGNKLIIAIVTLNLPGENNLMMKQEEIEEIYKSIKNRYAPEYINIFTNRGVEIAYDSKPDNLEIIKIPHAIFAELER